jgi:glycosyltransferase involved in cell wall biosynthesis
VGVVEGFRWLKGYGMRICFIVSEYAGIDRWGGFGVLTRDIAVGLVRRGHEVYVAMPLKPGQTPITHLDGVTIVAMPVPTYRGGHKAMAYASVLRMIDADIYHSQDATALTRVAQRATRRGKHVITFQDPRTIEDWRKQWYPVVRSRVSEWSFLFKYWRDILPGIKHADARYSQAKFVIDKTVRLYGLSEAPAFLPNPVDLPATVPVKAREPTVCFLARWEGKKRPEMFLDLAERFPAVKFILTGACRSDQSVEVTVRKRAAVLPNVTVPGWVDPVARSQILAQSWILANVSTNECLPVSYLEAAAHRCAIMAHINADDFASNYGYWAKEGTLDDFTRGLKELLCENRWKELGDKAYEYVLATHEIEAAIDLHLKAYERVLAGK